MSKERKLPPKRQHYAQGAIVMFLGAGWSWFMQPYLIKDLTFTSLHWMNRIGYLVIVLSPIVCVFIGISDICEAIWGNREWTFKDSEGKQDATPEV